jgi:hypothetical protein
VRLHARDSDSGTVATDLHRGIAALRRDIPSRDDQELQL